MMRPTSLWRSWTRKIVVFPEGISESIISSGNSTSWRMTNSRNSFTRSSLFDLRVLSRRLWLFVFVSCFECRSIFTDWPDFFPIRSEQPKPIVRSAPDEVAMLLNQEAIFVFAGGHELEVVPGKKIAFLTVRRVNDMDRAGCRPGRRGEI